MLTLINEKKKVFHNSSNGKEVNLKYGFNKGDFTISMATLILVANIII